MFLSLILFAADDMSANPSVDEAPVTHEAHVGEPAQPEEPAREHHHHHEAAHKPVRHVHKARHYHVGKKSAYGTDQCTKELNRHAIPHHHHHHHNGDFKK